MRNRCGRVCREESTCRGNGSILRHSRSRLRVSGGRGGSRRQGRAKLMSQLLLEKAFGLNMAKARAEVTFGASGGPIL
jgi:hypothetical protein